MAEPEQEADIVEVESPEHQLVERLGALLRQRRIALGMHQNDLALASGVGRRFIIDLEAGKSSCQIGKALLVAEALGIRLVELIEAFTMPHTMEYQGSGGLITGGAANTQFVPAATSNANADDSDLPDDLEDPAP